MNKKLLVTSIFLIISIFSNAQSVKNGIYKHNYSTKTNNDYICINNDTIIICLWNYKLCFMGAYKSKDNQLCLSGNTLLGKNVFITKEKCSPDSIELRLITKHKHYLLGMPSSDTNIYEYESDIYTMYLNKTSLVSRDTSGIYIAKGQFSDDALTNGFFLNDSGSGFFDYLSVPLEYGTRYIIKHKYYEFRPSVITKGFAPAFIYLYDYDNYRIIIKESNEDKNFVIYEYKNDSCNSCFNELKNRFPLLFE